MVYQNATSQRIFILHCFRTTNCYGLSIIIQVTGNTKRRFPYNELLWFIFRNSSRQRNITMFPYNELLWFISDAVEDKAKKLLFPYNELLWFILYSVVVYKVSVPVSVQRIVMVYLLLCVTGSSFSRVSVQRIVMVYQKGDNRMNELLKMFPYNELLWFILLQIYKLKEFLIVSVQRIVMVYRILPAGWRSRYARFRTTNCYGLSKHLHKFHFYHR